MFAVADLEDMIERLERRGGQLVGEIGQYKDKYRLCYMRGPEGVMTGLGQVL